MQATASLAPKLIYRLMDYALPPRCPACGTIVTQDNQFCSDCWSDLDFITPPWCATCQLPLGDSAVGGDQCASCVKEAPPFSGVNAVVAYGRSSAAIAMRLKYGKRTGFAGLIAQQLQRHLPSDGEQWLLVPVPLHRWRLWHRGFNQALLIARHLSKASGVPVTFDTLIRKKQTRSLRGLNPQQRAKEVKSVFAINPHRKAELKNRRVLLVDDIFTTGATARACTRILKRAGACEVRVVCWARVIPGRSDLDLGSLPPDIRQEMSTG